MSTDACSRPSPETVSCRPDPTACAPPLASVLLVALLGGCGAGAGSDEGRDARTLVLDTPEPLRRARIDPEALELVVELDGQTVDAVRDGEVWTVSATVPPAREVALELTWRERIGDNPLRLATLSESLGPFSADESVSIDPADYVTEPYDADVDGVSNLVERTIGTRPGDRDDPLGTVDAEIDVVVPQRDRRPNIDGFFGPFWQDGVVEDGVDGQPLAIDNLLVRTERSEAGDGEPPYRWYVSHDGSFLYLYVRFEPEGARTVTGDSESFFEDDAVSLFFDGDHGRAATLEGTGGGDDRYFFIRQLRREGETLPRAAAPLELAPVLPDIEYGATAIGWEIGVPLADIGVRIGEPFGFEVQIDQDLDGDGRDARWGWAYPIRANVEPPFERPLLNGTVLLID